MAMTSSNDWQRSDGDDGGGPATEMTSCDRGVQQQ